MVPLPYMKIINDGAHARGRGSYLQEFVITPQDALTLTGAVRHGSELYHPLGQKIPLRGSWRCLSIGGAYENTMFYT
ncbi:hypothetical protein [Enterobacter asburiae]|uniref:hypothetical protein n=1 Tax=Enterobacter cloacae complex TaxID=354276 RepID=UPI003D1F947E